jgi:putative RecB family exonuclease
LTNEKLNPPAYLSPSSISTFKQCPLKFKFSRIDKLPEPPTEATLRGNFVHDVLENLYMAEPERRSLELAKQISRLLWDQEWAEKVKEHISSPADLQNFRWSSWWCVEKLWDLEDPSSVTPSGLEYEVQVEVSGVPLRGFIDRFSANQQGLTVSDYKTGKTPNPRYSQDKFFQLFVYAVALRELGVGETTEAELLFLKDGERLHTEMTDADYESTIETLVSVKSAIDQRCAAGEFEPNKTKLCGWCHFKPICPAWK